MFPKSEDIVSIFVLLYVICLSLFTAVTSPSGSSLNQTVVKTAPMEIMAWIYPGKPTCTAASEFSDGRKIDVLKAEFFMIGEGGVMRQLTEENDGCNGYSEKNVRLIQEHSKAQYVTISSSDATNMGLFLSSSEKTNTAIKMLVSFVVKHRMTGIELDFEDFGGWNREIYSDYKDFVRHLGNALHAQNKKLMIDGPATSNAVEEAWYVWRYGDFLDLPVDQLVVMTYDYQFDQGAGQPISPMPWIQETIAWTRSRFSDISRLSFGIPSYGYKAIIGSQKISLLTYEQIQKEPGFATAHRDKRSSEMIWQFGDTVYVYQDSVSMDQKLRAIQAAGIGSVSIWHIGGNVWFSK